MNTQIKVQTYLQELLTAHPEVSFDGSQNTEDFIFRRLTSKKFRKNALDSACAERTRVAIQKRIQKDEPITVVYPQGGYKLWQFPTSPEVDWGEFFNIAYVRDYLLPITQAYKPGVELVYYMHTLLMERHDNLPQTEIMAYVESFQQLINSFSSHLPSNFKIRILRDADIYSREEYFDRLEEGKTVATQQYLELTDEKKADLRRMALLNIKWDGQEDWTKLSDKAKEEKLKDAALYEMAATSNFPKVMELVKSPENVLVFTKGTKDFIGIGSTKTSFAKYWVGTGVLETDNEGFFYPRVLTLSQYQQALTSEHGEVKVELVPGKNLSSIVVFPARFDFRKKL